MKSLICQNCRSPFNGDRDSRRFCSRRCAWDQAGKFHAPLDVRFWRCVEKTEGCWIWKGAKSKATYGQIGNGGKVIYAHRLSWEINRGPITSGLQVLHHCDNPPCVNPDHLFLGTNADNINDRVSKGRSRVAPPRGSKHYNCKLNESQVIAIRTRYAQGGITMKVLAEEYSVQPNSIWSIIQRKGWTHV